MGEAHMPRALGSPLNFMLLEEYHYACHYCGISLGYQKLAEDVKDSSGCPGGRMPKLALDFPTAPSESLSRIFHVRLVLTSHHLTKSITSSTSGPKAVTPHLVSMPIS